MEGASYRGPEIPDKAERIEELLLLWQAPIPEGWQRALDARLLTPERYVRTHQPGGATPLGEHAVEHSILAPDPREVATSCLGASLIDGVNAVPLARDLGGGRAGNVEADMALLVRDKTQLRLLLVEVKVASNHAWYAAVENLRQMRLFLEAPVSLSLFQRRLPDLGLGSLPPVTGVVLAPHAFYAAKGQKGRAVGPTQDLLARFRAQLGITVVLATWEGPERAIRPYEDERSGRR
jgi:hypothetical protein